MRELFIWKDYQPFGMIYSPVHGEMAFTVPFFDEFMRRVMTFQVRGAIPA